MEREQRVDGYVFLSAKEYERARKEKETIAYLRAKTDLSNPKAVYQVYKKAIEKQSFQTIFGFEFMQELRKRLIEANVVPEDVIDPIPIGRVQTEENPGNEHSGTEMEEQVKKYEEMAEKAKAGSIIKNFLIGVLLAVVVIIIVMTYNSKYSVFTFFTNYENEIRQEVLNEYEEWENELEEREKKIKETEE